MSPQASPALPSRRSILTLITAVAGGLGVGMLTACGQGHLIWISNDNVDWAQSGQPPARTSDQNSPLLQQDWAWEVRAFGQATATYGRYEISPPGDTQIQPLWGTAINEVVANKRPVKTILDDYADQIKGVMAQQ